MKISLLLLLLLVFGKTEVSQITVKIKGIPSVKGSVFVALFRKQDNFPTFGGQFIGKVVSVTSGEMIINFDDLPHGEYAIACYHDKNNNQKLDKNSLGIPTEHYGFSNNARRMFSAPSFKEASFEMKANRVIAITLK